MFINSLRTLFVALAANIPAFLRSATLSLATCGLNRVSSISNERTKELSSSVSAIQLVPSKYSTCNLPGDSAIICS